MAAEANIDPDELDTMVRTLSGECRSEPLNGQLAVAYVIKNRAQWSPAAWWGHTIGQVCRKPYQFSCWSQEDWNASNLAHMIRLEPTDSEYIALETACLDVLHGNVPDPTHGATHYKVKGTPASWERAVAGKPVIEIGHHQFWRLGPHE